MFKIFVLLLIAAGSVGAVEFTVNSTTDSVDAAPGNGQCSDSTGQCSLRAAVMEANALAGADVIYLPRGSTHTLTLIDLFTDFSGVNDLDVTDDLTVSVENPGVPASSWTDLPVVQGQVGGAWLDRVFEVNGAQNVLFYGIGVAFGNAQSSLSHPRQGGAIYVGSGVTQFTLANSFLIFNRAGFGAGIYSEAANTTVSLSDISLNTWVAPVPISAGGNGIVTTFGGNLRLQYSSVHHNESTQDVGISTSSVHVTAPPQSAVILSSTVSANGHGQLNQTAFMGGVSIAQGDMFLINATVTDNDGVGVFQGGSSGTSALFVRNSVFSGNGLDVPFNCVTHNPPYADFGDGAGNGHNLSSDASCNLPANSGNRENTDPLLSPLWGIINHNEPIFVTQHPLHGSPLIDSGSALAPNAGNPNACHQFDQRLIERPQFGGYSNTCDIGAYELDDLIYTNGFGLIVL